MAVNLSVSSNLPEVIARVERMAAEVPLAAQMAVGRAAVAVGHVIADAIYQHTPVGPSVDGQEHLRDTGESDITIDGMTATITERQTKTIPIGGDDVPLAQVLRTGHRAFDVSPTNKQALYWPGADHPVPGTIHIPAVQGIDYVSGALAEAQPEIEAILAASGEQMAVTVLEVMR